VIIGVGTVLEAPYTVTIDGAPVDTYYSYHDETIDQSGITIEYSHSTHEIVITGANVVPEFPFAVIGLFAGLVAVIAIISRFRSSNHSLI
jgi:hypothetical protein